MLNPEAIGYLVAAVNRHLETSQAAAEETRHGLARQLERVEEELGNVEKAILAGVVSETTAALVKDRGAQRRALTSRLEALEAQQESGRLRADADLITAEVNRLNDVLNQDLVRANAFFRQHIAPIRCSPVEAGGKRFYRATANLNGAEMIKSLGLAQAFDLGGCGGWI